MDIKYQNFLECLKNKMKFRNNSKRFLPVLIILIGAILGGYFLGDYLNFETFREKREILKNARDAHLIFTIFSFVFFYTAIVAFSLPAASLFSVIGGFLFGLPLGTCLNVLSASLGATIFFLALRIGTGDFHKRKFNELNPKFNYFVTRLRYSEFNVLLTLRLLPVIPFFLVNILAALVGVRLVNFVCATTLGIIPGGIVYTSIGSGIGEVVDESFQPDLSIFWSSNIFLPICGLALLSALPVFFRKIKP